MAGEWLARNERRFGRRKCPDRDIEQFGGGRWPNGFLRRLGLLRRDLDCFRISLSDRLRHGLQRRDYLHRPGLNDFDRLDWLGGQLGWGLPAPRGFLLGQFVVQTRQRFERRPRAGVFDWYSGLCFRVGRDRAIRTVILAASQHYDVGILGWKIDGGGRQLQELTLIDQGGVLKPNAL